MRILTFNHHEAYLFSLADTGHHYDVVEKVGRLDLHWNQTVRPLPRNFRLIPFDRETKHRLRQGYYDIVLCHTLKNLLWCFFYFRPKYIFVAHIPLFFMTPGLAVKALVKKLVLTVFKWTHRFQFVAVSEFKRRMWGERGKVILLTPTDFGSIEPPGPDTPIAVVCNQLADRGEELGVEMLNALQERFPIQIIGNNPGIAAAIHPKSQEEFVKLLRQTGIYLYTIRYPYGDGYNTAMLEAMNMGMAIVTVDNPSSPIDHGENGLVGRTLEDLAQHLERLRKDPALTVRLGKAAKKTIADRFSREQFLTGWSEVLTGSNP